MAFSAIVVAVCYFVGLFYNHPVPEGLPDDQLWSARVCGAGKQILSSLATKASKFGIGDSPIENLNSILDWVVQTGIKDGETEQGFMEIQDVNITNVPVRIYTPKYILSDIDAGKKSTGVVYLHGGGWISGSVYQYHPLTYQLAKEADVVLISVNYRLAPKNTFPVQFNDCYAVVNTLLATAEKYGIDRNRIVVAGDSAGGNLAAAIALKLRDENKRLAAQILIYPALQFMDFSLPSIKKQSSALLTRDSLAVYWSYYMTGTPDMASSFLVKNHSMHLRNTKYSSYIRVNDQEQRKAQQKPLDEIPKAVIDGLTDYRASPLMAGNVKELPKTLLITCEYDVLKDDSLLYKARLQGAGVQVSHYNYMTYHTFLSVQMAPLFRTEEFRQAFQDIVDYIKEL